MKKAKIVLTAVAAVAAVGATFALNAKKATGVLLKLDPNNDGICEVTSEEGYAYTDVAVGVRPQYLIGNATVTLNPTSTPSACTSKYYLFAD